MSADYKQRGDVIQYTAGADISARDVVVIDNIVGVALVDIANGSTGSVQIAGVFNFPKKAADNLTQGLKVYWDATNSEVTLTDTSNTLMGVVFVAAAATTTSVDVLLNVVN